MTTPDATVEYCVSHVNAAGSPRSITIPAENKGRAPRSPVRRGCPDRPPAGRGDLPRDGARPADVEVASWPLTCYLPISRTRGTPTNSAYSDSPAGRAALRSERRCEAGLRLPGVPAFVLCAKCALPPGFSPDVEQDEKDCVAVDVGRARWLSRRIEFKGNYTRILTAARRPRSARLDAEMHSGIRLRLRAT